MKNWIKTEYMYMTETKKVAAEKNTHDASAPASYLGAREYRGEKNAAAENTHT